MIAVIAGSGAMPIAACQALIARGIQFFVVSLFPEENGPALQKVLPHRDALLARPAWRAGDILRELKERATKQLLFIGKVDKQLLLKKISLDWLALQLLARCFGKGDREIMEQLLGFARTHNIEVLSQSDVLNIAHIAPGVICGDISPLIERTIERGMHLAREISRLDIGQTVVMKDEMVIAIEAIEGTDACIARAHAIAGDSIVICKAAYPAHNDRYDLPVLGPHTIAPYAPGALAAIAWCSQKTLIAEQDQFVTMAQERGIALVSCA